MGLIASVVGATGLVGRELIAQLCDDKDIDAVHALSRRALPDLQHIHQSKLSQWEVDFDRLADVAWPCCDVLFCCLGTTIKAAGSKDRFRMVDVDYVVGSAHRAHQAGASTLAIVSALGADPKSKVFYSRTKGEMEAAVSALDFAHVVIVRPSLLEGPRADRRVGERVALAASKLINPILPARYRPVAASAVARAMLASAKSDARGITIFGSEQLATFV
jgi:uncharacterized protein YbjT (DUF2867 family)